MCSLIRLWLCCTARAGRTAGAEGVSSCARGVPAREEVALPIGGGRRQAAPTAPAPRARTAREGHNFPDRAHQVSQRQRLETKFARAGVKSCLKSQACQKPPSHSYLTGNLSWSPVINQSGAPAWPQPPSPFEVRCPLQHEEIICCLIQWAISAASRPNDMWEY